MQLCEPCLLSPNSVESLAGTALSLWLLRDKGETRWSEKKEKNIVRK